MKKFLFLLSFVLFSSVHSGYDYSDPDAVSRRLRDFDKPKAYLDVQLFFISHSIEILSRAALYIALTVLVGVVTKKILNKEKDAKKEKKKAAKETKETEKESAESKDDDEQTSEIRKKPEIIA